jgi:hypothetical protein
MPYTWSKESIQSVSGDAVPIITLPHLNMEVINKEDAKNEGSGIPLRFGFSHEANLTL